MINLESIVWKSIEETPPNNKSLLIVTADGSLGVGGYISISGKIRRYVVFWIYEPERAKAGETVCWAELPSLGEIKGALGFD